MQVRMGLGHPHVFNIPCKVIGNCFGFVAITMTSTLPCHRDLTKLSDKPNRHKQKMSPLPQAPIREIAENWIEQFDEGIRSKNYSAVRGLFKDDGIELSTSDIDVRMVERYSGDIMGISH